MIAQDKTERKRNVAMERISLMDDFFDYNNNKKDTLFHDETGALEFLGDTKIVFWLVQNNES